MPSGRLETTAVVEGGKVRSVTFRNVPSLRLGDRRSGPATHAVDVAFGGAFYASLEERVEPRELPRLIELGRELKRALEAEHEIVHPLEPELRDVYGVIFWQHEGDAPFAQRNVTVFADGEVDRSPCGSGTSARLALLDASRPAAARRDAPPSLDRRLRVRRDASSGRTRSPGARRWSRRSRAAPTARARASFTLDPDDPLGEGFLLR